MSPYIPIAHSRRDFLAGRRRPWRIALNWLLAHDARRRGQGRFARTRSPRGSRTSQPKAKRVIFLFMVGGPRQMDLFDPKPALEKWAGKPLPESTGRPKSQFTSGGEVILPSTRKFAQARQERHRDLRPACRTSRRAPTTSASCARAGARNTVHAPAMYELHSGRTLMGFPSLGQLGDLRPRQREREPARRTA